MRPLPGQRRVTEQFAAGEGDDTVRGEPRVGRARRVADPCAQPAQQLTEPGGHLGHPGQRVDEFGRGGRGGDIGDALALRDQRARHGVLVAEDDIRAERVDGGLDARRHQVGQRYEELLPEEPEGGGSGQLRRPDQSARGHGAVEDRDVPAGEPVDLVGVAGPSHRVPPPGEFAGHPDQRVDMPDQRRDDEQEAGHRTAPASV